MIKQLLVCGFLCATLVNTKAQTREITIEKKLAIPKKITVDTTTSMTIVVNGDKITINGKEVDKNDPRLHKIKRNLKPTQTETITIDSLDPQGEMDDLDEMDMMNPFNKIQITQPRANKAFLGVVTEEHEKGALINEVNEESPAAKAGLKKGDIISKVNADNIASPKDLYEAIGKCKPDEKVVIAYDRDGKKNSMTVTLAKNKSIIQFYNVDPKNAQAFKIPREQKKAFGFALPNMPNIDGMMYNMKRPKIGISIEDLEEGNGVKIKTIVPSSPAEKAGLKVGDIITSFDKHEIKEVADLRWENFEAGQVIQLEIIRNKDHKTIELKIPKKINSADL